MRRDLAMCSSTHKVIRQRNWVQSALAITDLVITETLLDRTLFKALPCQSDLAITDKLKFWWSRYNGNLVFHVRYSKGGLYLFLMRSNYSFYQKKEEEKKTADGFS